MEQMPRDPQPAADEGRVRRLAELLHRGAARIRHLEAEMASLRGWAVETLVAAEARLAAADHRIRHLQSSLDAAEARARAAERHLRDVQALQDWLGPAPSRRPGDTGPRRAA
ncbi:MAG TPA: hypothetical protein VHL98_00590 [Microvirga sp.]|nr:hypothetical protein [Microvirga sp.]